MRADGADFCCAFDGQLVDYGQSLYTGPQVGFAEGQFVHFLSVEVVMKIPVIVTAGLEEHRSEGKLNRFRLDDHGREILDSRPMEPPVGYVKRESISDQIRRMVLQVSQEIASNEVESLEESNDFYVEDDPGSALPGSQYEFDEDFALLS